MPKAALKSVDRHTRRPVTAKRKNKTPQDWKDEEKNEREAKAVRPYVGAPLVQPEDIVVGDSHKIKNWDDPKWLDAAGERITVSFFYPTQGVIIDYPTDEVDLARKQAAFKKLKIPYLGIAEGKDLAAKEARAELKKQGAKLAA